MTEIITPDGRVLQERSPPHATRVEIPTRSQAQRIVTNTRRKLADLPALPKQLNALSAVLVYSMSGLSDEEISAATSLPISQIAGIRNTPAYCVLENNVIAAVRDSFTNEAADVLVRARIKAAEKLESHLDSDFDAISLRAAEAVLSKHADAVTNTKSSSMDALLIEVVDKRNSALPSLNLGE